MVSAVELGKIRPSLPALQHFAQRLGVSLGQLVRRQADAELAGRLGREARRQRLPNVRRRSGGRQRVRRPLPGGREVRRYLQRADVGQLGYTVVIWRGRHAADVTDLTHDEAAGFWCDIIEASRRLERVYRPAKLNLMLLGNLVPHLHAHLVPRYTTDDSPGRHRASCASTNRIRVSRKRRSGRR